MLGWQYMPLNVDWMVNKMVISCDGILEGGSHCGVVRYKVRYKMLAAPFATDFSTARIVSAPQTHRSAPGGVFR